MGLAASGTPLFADALRDRVIDIAHDGSYKLDMTYFVYQHRDAMLSDRFNDLLGGPPRQKREPLSQRFADVAASVQMVLEEVLLKQARFAHAVTGASDLCLAGGVALNCVANAKLLKESGFERIWIQPAAGDAGGALGAALTIAAEEGEITPESARALQQGSYLGPAFAEAEIEALLKTTACSYQRLSPSDLCEAVAAELEKGRIVGWFQGRMEFGPRALGNRSILADPRDPAMKSRLNARIKHREAFRPFAPITLETEAGRHFQMCAPSPYMLLVAPVLSPHLPAVTHEDGTARVQTLSTGMNPLMEQLLAAFGRRTGSAVLVNTSFNDADEPIVCTPLDALRTFCTTNLDALVLGPFLVSAVDPILAPPSSTVAKPSHIPQPLWQRALTATLFMLIVLPFAIPIQAWNAFIGIQKRESYWLRQ
jgi:carbamoyltransferase